MCKNSIQLFENQYIPCVNWFKISSSFSYIKISSCEPYKKMTFKNRCVVAGGNGLVTLSIPIENGRAQHCAVKEVKIANHEPWQKVHWRTLQSCYSKSPFWEYYADVFSSVYDKNFTYLFDFNLEIIEKLWRRMDKTVQVSVDDSPWDYQHPTLGSNILPNNYQKMAQNVVYEQLFEDRIGFQANLSMIDLLSMEGPEAVHLLRR